MRRKRFRLTTWTYLVRQNVVWAVASFRSLLRNEGHVSAEHLVLAHSAELTAEYRAAGRPLCGITADHWFARPTRGILVRVHSECLLSETFAFDVCDCRAQLVGSMERIALDGEGLVVYLRQEGRGIGLGAKLRTLGCDPSLDTYERNVAAGFPEDVRKYDAAGVILQQIGVTTIRLITDSPWKAKALSDAGLTIRERIGLTYPLTPEAARELLAKKRRGYDIDFTEAALEAALSISSGSGLT